jgi:hypothetical protein
MSKVGLGSQGGILGGISNLLGCSKPMFVLYYSVGCSHTAVLSILRCHNLEFQLDYGRGKDFSWVWLVKQCEALGILLTSEV